MHGGSDGRCNACMEGAWLAGLWACCNKYGLCSLASRLVGLEVSSMPALCCCAPSELLAPDMVIALWACLMVILVGTLR